MVLAVDQSDLGMYVKVCKMALNLEGYTEDREIFKIICDSFTEESRKKLKSLGLEEGEFTMYDLENVLVPNKTAEITLEEELLIPQKAQENVQAYLKRLKSLLPQFGCEAPSVEEFMEIIEKGLHPNLKESVRNTILEQMKRLSRKSLKEMIEQLEGALKVIAESSKDRILKPRNTCSHCRERDSKAFDLDGLEEAFDEFE